MKIQRSQILLSGLLAAVALFASGTFGVAGVAEADVKIVVQSDPKPSTAAALAAFDTVQKVLQNPRCQNCHIPGDAPLQFDNGLKHAQNVQRGPDGKGAAGLPCSTCHAQANPPASYGAHMPPGAPNWALPAPSHKMVFIGLTKAELCRTVKDPKRNGNRDAAALLEHVDHDKLVLWGWQPGVGRAPVAVPHAEFVASFKTWLDAGAPCPDSPGPAKGK